ncbi:MAG TPA: M20/M25/M40 family metallo-hydrolase, partial [Gemmatimonadaceae bacterium]|nr:M20/M25/M40 family metallo-hydrolase [Gemmatimonadaceae bacterium]
WVAALLRMKQESIVPAGDYILALTAGEEGGSGYVGIEWLIAHRRDLLDVEYVLNPDAGGGELDHGKPIVFTVQAAEKVFHTLHLTVRNPGGHSSLPVRDNAINRLAAALGRVAAYDFPFETNAVTRASFARRASLATGSLASEMRAVSGPTLDRAAATRLASRSAFYNAMLRTTCIATMIDGGHAVNALPQRVQATVNCRILPGKDPVEVERTIRRVVADTAVVVAAADTATPSPPSPLPPALEATLKSIVTPMWGALPIVPTMETGATDGLYLRNAGLAVYGVTGLFVDPNNADDVRAHGLNERIGVKQYYDQLEFTYRLLKALGEGGAM